MEKVFYAFAHVAIILILRFYLFCMSNAFLFTGEDRYVVDQEVARWRDGFVQKFGSDAVFVYGPENFDPAAIMENCLGGGLFVSKKMVIIKHAPTDSYGKIPAQIMESFAQSYMKQYTNISPDTIILFISYKPDKRLKFYKFLDKNTEHKVFKPLSEWQRKSTVQQWTESIQRDADALDYFLLQVGTDMYRVQSETDKVLTRAQVHNKQNITKTDIDTVVFGQVQANTFALFDYLFVDVKKSLHIIDTMRDQWTNRNEAIGALYRGVMLFIMMVDSYHNGARDAKSIAQRGWYAPFAVSKQFGRLQTFVQHYDDIKALYKGLVAVDVSIKTGKLPAEAFWIKSKDLLYQYAWWRK